MTPTTAMSDQAAALLFGALAVVVWALLVGWREEATECAARCFRHGSRPRLHIPCSRCVDNHRMS